MNIWLSYQSDESGRWQIYLDSFPSIGIQNTIGL